MKKFWVMLALFALITLADTRLIVLYSAAESRDGEMAVLEAKAAAHWQRYTNAFARVQSGLDDVGLRGAGVWGRYYDVDGSTYVVLIPEFYMLPFDMCDADLEQCPPAGTEPAATEPTPATKDETI